MTEEREEYNVYAVLPRQVNPYALNTQLQPVNWREMREKFNPQGPEMPARELVGRTFTILELRPVPSSYQEGDTFFYVRAVLSDTGAIFHTSLGGQAVVEVLADFHALNTAYLSARETNDTARMAELESVGAGAPITVSLGWKAQGQFSGYYTLE